MLNIQSIIMDKENQKVSIIIPTYNSERTIWICLESIKKQTYTDIEIIVVDNNSKDNTKDIALKYTNLVFNQWPERTAQKNFWLKQATWRYVLIIDWDMSMDNDLIERCVKKARKNKDFWWICIPLEDKWNSFWVKCIAFERYLYVWSLLEAARFLNRQEVIEIWWFPEDIIFFEEFVVPQKLEEEGFNVRLRTKAKLYHHYEDFNFFNNLKKRYYYWKTLNQYSKLQNDYFTKQMSIKYRLWIFFSKKEFYQKFHLSLWILFLKFTEVIAANLWKIAKKIFD